MFLTSLDVLEMRCLAVLFIVVCSSLMMGREGVSKRQSPPPQDRDQRENRQPRTVGFVQFSKSSMRIEDELDRRSTSQPNKGDREIEISDERTSPTLLYPSAIESTPSGHDILRISYVAQPRPGATTSSQQRIRGRWLRKVSHLQPQTDTDDWIAVEDAASGAAKAVRVNQEPDKQTLFSAMNFLGTSANPSVFAGETVPFLSKTKDDQAGGKPLPSLIAIFNRESSSVRHGDGGQEASLKKGAHKQKPFKEKNSTSYPPIITGESTFIGSTSKGSSKSSLKPAPSECEKTTDKEKRPKAPHFGCKTRKSALPTSQPTVTRSMSPTTWPNQATTVLPTQEPRNEPTRSISPTSSPTHAPSSSSPSYSPSDLPSETLTTLSTAVPSESPSDRQCGTIVNCVLFDLVQGTAVANLTATAAVMYTINDNASFSISCYLLGNGDSIVSVYGTGETHILNTNAPNQYYWLEGDVDGFPNPVSYLATAGDKTIDVNVTLGGTSCVNFTQLLVGSV